MTRTKKQRKPTVAEKRRLRLTKLKAERAKSTIGKLEREVAKAQKAIDAAEKVYSDTSQALYRARKAEKELLKKVEAEETALRRSCIAPVKLKLKGDRYEYFTTHDDLSFWFEIDDHDPRQYNHGVERKDGKRWIGPGGTLREAVASAEAVAGSRDFEKEGWKPDDWDGDGWE